MKRGDKIMFFHKPERESGAEALRKFFDNFLTMREKHYIIITVIK